MDQAVIEILDRDGQVRLLHKVLAWPVSVGRSPACDLVLDDAHLAAQHAQLSWDEQGASVLLEPSLNGGWLGKRHLLAGAQERLAEGEVLQLGQSVLRVRSTRGSLAPERPMDMPEHSHSRWRAAQVPLLLLAWGLLLWFDQWLQSDPGAPAVDYVRALLLPLVAVVAWATVWGLITKLFQHWFAFVPHFRRALIFMVGVHVCSLLLPPLAYGLSLPRLLVLDDLLLPIGGTALLWWHASLVWPRAQRRLMLGLVAMLLVGQGLAVAKRSEQQYWFGQPYMASLLPPAFRMVAPQTPESLIDSMRDLEAQLARQARKDNDAQSQDGMGE